MPYWQFSLVTANTARHSALLIPPAERVEISTMREFEHEDKAKLLAGRLQTEG